MSNFNSFLNEIASNKKTLSMPYIIAEIGVNHEGSIEKAMEMIKSAKESGAHAVKFQSYKAEKLASKNSPSYWDTTKEKTESQFELFKKHDKFGEEEFISLYNYCKEINIDFSSTPFDFDSADYLNKLCEFFKISSSDLTNIPFIKYLCDFKKPIILSVGAANIEEINETVNVIRAKGNDLILLHCVLNYPTKNENANLGAITYLKNEFPTNIIGYSDHTVPGKYMKPCELAFMLGAKVIEKHYTFNKDLKGNDHYHAMDSSDLSFFTKTLKENIKLFGASEIIIDSQLSAIKNARRSLYYADDFKKGHVLGSNDIEIKRPGIGISPKEMDSLIGKKISLDVKYDDIINLNHFK